MFIIQTPIDPNIIHDRFVTSGLAAGLGYGAATEAVRRATSSAPSPSQSSVFMSEANVRRMVDKLSRMRGAALKLGQFMSIQGTWMKHHSVTRIDPTNQ
jgi:aarF domain-containing kinase